MKRNGSMGSILFFLLAVLMSAALAIPSAHSSSDSKLEILTLSSRPELVSGGNALVQINVPKNVPLDSVIVTLNGKNVAGAFHSGNQPGSLLGLVEGLVLGKNSIVAKVQGGHYPGQHDANLELVNYPITGPIFSGPHEEPFICTTNLFTLPDGTFLGPALDADCSVTTRIHYMYRTTATPATFKELPPPYAHPADLAFTTTNDGRTVPYIVRIETGTINRAIYQTAVLNDPLINPGPSPFDPPSGWNKKLIYPLGGGCQGGWYTQAKSIMNVLTDAYLRRGYGVAASTLNTLGNNCNDLLSSETAAMVKERFVESYGLPVFTIGTGSSGGSIQSNETAQTFPGLYDGIITSSTFPDVTSMAGTLAAARFLDVYFNQTAPGQFTEEQQEAVSGFFEVGEIVFLSRSAGTSALRMDPVAVFPADLPVALRYDPVSNPKGARATIWDHTVNVYGRYPDNGFARRPLDNVGVQYGLKALNDGVISVDQFLDLNEKIGGVDIDFKSIPERTVADRGATRRAYESGRINSGGGGLAETPIITTPGYGDIAPAGNIHLKFWSFALRERLIRENGHADNQVILGPGVPATVSDARFDQMDQWLTAILADKSDLPKAEKVVRNKPADLVDACWDSSGNKIIEYQTAFGPGQCNTLYPACLDPAMVAGAPLARDIVKCQLKPVDMSDYRVTFSSAQRARLHKIFAEGVCDWSKRGVEQRPLKGTWLSFGPSPDNLLFDVTRPGQGQKLDEDLAP